MSQYFRNLTARPSFGAFALLTAIVVVALVIQPLTITAYGVTFDRVTANIMVAAALTLVIVLGEIDLSVGATMAVAGVVVAQNSENLIFGVVAALATAVVIGAVNAFLIVVLRVNSFIATLGTMTTLTGLALLLTGSAPVPLADLTVPIFFAEKVIGQLTVPMVIVLLLTVVVALVMSRTRLGRDFYAVGGNLDAARVADINVDRTKAVGFILCSLLASVAGILGTIKQGSADPNMGQSVLLVAIAGAVLGGAVLTGGRGSVIGAAIGSIALGAIAVTLELNGLSASLERVVSGIILFIAVVANRRGLGGLRLDILRRRLTSGRPSARAVNTSASRKDLTEV